MSNKPLTDEQLWGIPDKDRPTAKGPPPANYCPYKDRACQFWDQGCQADMCVFNEGEK